MRPITLVILIVYLVEWNLFCTGRRLQPICRREHHSCVL